MNQKTTWGLLAVVLLLGVAIFIYSQQTRLTDDNRKIQEQLESGQITEFTLNGSVNKIESGKIYLQTGLVQETDRGMEFVPQEKIIVTNDQTEITMGTPARPGKLMDIKAGSILIVSTSTNPFNELEVQADKIFISTP